MDTKITIMRWFQHRWLYGILFIRGSCNYFFIYRSLFLRKPRRDRANSLFMKNCLIQPDQSSAGINFQWLSTNFYASSGVYLSVSHHRFGTQCFYAGRTWTLLLQLLYKNFDTPRFTEEFCEAKIKRKCWKILYFIICWFYCQ